MCYKNRTAGADAPPDVNSRVVLITGASLGIGRACADYLHRRGYRVFGASRRMPLPSAAFEMVRMDVDDDASVEQGVATVLERAGRLDVVVNNAGFGLAGALEDTSLTEAKAQFETNFFGIVRVCRAVLPTMRAQGCGYIVNISSLAGRLGLPFQGFYSATKFALEGYSEALYFEVKPFGIRLVLIEPGDFRTSFSVHRRQVTPPNSVYAVRYARAMQAMEINESQGADPILVARLLERIIRSPAPRLRYTVGHIWERLAVALVRCAPVQLFDWALGWYYRL